MKTMPPQPAWLSAAVAGRPVGVDRKEKVLRGYIVAQEGPFKSEGRGEFDRLSLESIVALGNARPAGLKSRFTHPDMSSDGLGKFLGRSRGFSMSEVRNAEGKTVAAVRADLHFDPSAEKTPQGNLADYVMSLAESDPDALSSSLVLRVEKLYRKNDDGTLAADAEGNELPPLWRPKVLHASDVVDTGDAVDGLLSAGVDVDGLPLAALWRGAELLDGVFAGQPRDVVEARAKEWLGRYLAHRFGEADAGTGTRRLRQAAREKGR